MKGISSFPSKASSWAFITLTDRGSREYERLPGYTTPSRRKLTRRQVVERALLRSIQIGMGFGFTSVSSVVSLVTRTIPGTSRSYVEDCLNRMGGDGLVEESGETYDIGPDWETTGMGLAVRDRLTLEGARELDTEWTAPDFKTDTPVSDSLRDIIRLTSRDSRDLREESDESSE